MTSADFVCVVMSAILFLGLPLMMALRALLDHRHQQKLIELEIRATEARNESLRLQGLSDSLVDGLQERGELG